MVTNWKDAVSAPAPHCPARFESSTGPFPAWMSQATKSYLTHVGIGVPIREIARRQGVHASTILRQIRKIEAQRDDPLKDEALELYTNSFSKNDPSELASSEPSMSANAARPVPPQDDDIEREARRILRRLCETSAFLLVSPDLPQAAVFRETVPGRKTRTAVVDREVAQAFALKDWIEGRQSGRVGIYSITNAGRSALKRMLAQERKERTGGDGFAEAPSPFLEQHREYGDRVVSEPGGPRKMRYNLAESPLTALARKRGPDGSAYLSSAMLQAGERLREDFELAQMGPRITQNWDNFLTASTSGSYQTGEGGGSAAARDRVAAALKAIGPGLADIAFRCCCFLEGLETAEKRLGWSARAGKVVLRIALQRLDEHYQNSSDSRLIG